VAGNDADDIHPYIIDRRWHLFVPQARAAIAAMPEQAAMIEALRLAQRAITVWTLTYADDMCDESDVAAARAEISEHGGTLGYMADVNAAIDAALEPSP
jgi:hypothetical protein